MTREVKEWWEETADYFQEEIDLNVGVNWTGFGADDLELLGDVNGLDVLELGCGGGQCTVAVAKRSASVTGVDISSAQLAHARKLVDEHDVDADLLQADVTDLSMIVDRCFDLAFNAYVFQWIGDVERCFEETYRVLRPGGRFVFSTPHPFYEVADPETHRVEESYFESGRRVVAHDGLDADQVTYRHRVSDLHNALVEAGFRVERLHEPGSDDPEEYQAGPWGERTPELMSKLPSTLAFEARKP